MGFLESLSGGLVGLILASLLLISIGFFWDSSQSSVEPAEPKPLSRPMLVALAVGYPLLGYYWTNNLLAELAKAEPDWLMTVISAFWIVLCILEFFKYALAAIRHERSGDISP